ncbi:unnamed protein product, partial [Boreogadus saida]
SLTCCPGSEKAIDCDVIERLKQREGRWPPLINLIHWLSLAFPLVTKGLLFQEKLWKLFTDGWETALLV